MIALLAALALAAYPHPSGAAAPPSLSRRERETARAASEKGEGETPDQVARRYGLAGEVLVAKGGKVLLDRGYGTIDPKGGAAHRAGGRWRLASITKQVTAALLLKALAENGNLSKLDQPFKPTAGGVQPAAGPPTIRDFLTHHSGLANPDDTPKDAEGVPSFYATIQPGAARLLYCFSRSSRHAAPFAYNNCDYIWLRFGMGDRPWPPGMTMALPDEIGVPGFVGGKPEPRFQLASWGAAGGLMGTAEAVLAFDRSLMTGKLLPAAVRDGELWKPEGNGSYQALGQWVFPGRLKGCAAPKRIVQRDGEIYGVQARNFILPDDDLVVIVFTNRSADDFRIGEVWEGKGFAYDLLSAAACA